MRKPLWHVASERSVFTDRSGNVVLWKDEFQCVKRKAKFKRLFGGKRRGE
jgi:hypothetical protein